MKLQNEKKYRLYCTVKYKTLIPIKDWRPVTCQQFILVQLVP